MVVIVGLGFDFTNGFHDSANAMATSIATGALKPKVAVAMSGAGQPRRRIPVACGRGDHRQGHCQSGRSDHRRRLRRPVRGRRLERDHLVSRHPVQFVARPDRRCHRRDHGERRRQRGALERSRLQGLHPGGLRADHRRRRRRGGHLARLPSHEASARQGAHDRVPLGAGRHGHAGLAGARHE